MRGRTGGTQEQSDDVLQARAALPALCGPAAPSLPTCGCLSTHGGCCDHQRTKEEFAWSDAAPQPRLLHPVCGDAAASPRLAAADANPWRRGRCCSAGGGGQLQWMRFLNFVFCDKLSLICMVYHICNCISSMGTPNEATFRI